MKCDDRKTRPGAGAIVWGLIPAWKDRSGALAGVDADGNVVERHEVYDNDTAVEFLADKLVCISPEQETSRLGNDLKRAKAKLRRADPTNPPLELVISPKSGQTAEQHARYVLGIDGVIWIDTVAWKPRDRLRRLFG